MKQKRVIIIAFALLLTMVLSIALVACNKQKTPVDEAKPEVVSADALSTAIKNEIGLENQYTFNGFPESGDFSSEAGDAYILEMFESFSEYLEEAGFLNEKADKLLDVIFNFELRMPSSPSLRKAYNPFAMFTNAIPQIIEVLAQIGMTEDDVATIITCGYKAVYKVYSENDYYGRYVDAAAAYIAEIDEYLAGEENAEVLTYLKNNAKLTYVQKCLVANSDNELNYLGMDDKGVYFLTEKQYEEIKAIINSVIPDTLADLDTAKTEIGEDKAYATLLNYAQSKVGVIALINPITSDTFKKELDAYNKISDAYYEFFDSLWLEVFEDSGYVAQTAEAYDFVDKFYNGIAADEANGIEAVKGYKDICPTTTAVIPADYTGLTYEWLRKFDLAMSQDKYNVRRYKSIYTNNWYRNAYAVTQYITIFDKTEDFVAIPESLNDAVIDVIEPMVKSLYRLANTVSSFEGIISGEKAIAKSDVSAILDSVNAVADDLTVFAADNGAKLKTLTTEARAFIKEQVVYSDIMTLCDVLDSFVNLAPDIAKIAKIFTAALTPETIDAFVESGDFFCKNIYYFDYDIASTNITVAAAKMFFNIINNPAVDTADEMVALVTSLIDNSVGVIKAELIYDITEELNYNGLGYMYAMDYYELMQTYNASFECDVNSMDDVIDFISDFYGSYDISDVAFSYITASYDEYVVEEQEWRITEKSFNAFRADILNVANICGISAKNNALNAVEEVADALFNGITSYVTEVNPYTDAPVTEEVKTTKELIAMLANHTLVKSPLTYNKENESWMLSKDVTDIEALTEYVLEAGGDIFSTLFEAVSEVTANFAWMLNNESGEKTVEAVFAENSLISDKIFVDIENEYTYIEFVYTGEYSHFYVNLLGDMDFDRIPDLASIYVVNANGGYSRYSSCYDDGDGIDLASGYDLVPGFKYALRLNSQYYSSGIVFFECYYDIECEITFDEPENAGDVVLVSNEVEVYPTYQRFYKVFFTYQEIDGYELILKCYKNARFSFATYDGAKGGFVFNDGILVDGEEQVILYSAYVDQMKFSLEYIAQKEIAFTVGELTSETITVAAGERADVLFTYAEKTGYSLDIVCSDADVTIADFGASEGLVNGTTYKMFYENDTVEDVTFKLVYTLDEAAPI